MALLHLILLVLPLPSLALPANWFLDAERTWRKGRHHPWFWTPEERLDRGLDESAGQQFEKIPTDDLKDLIPEIFRLRHAFVALQAVPNATNARKIVLKAHRAAMKGQEGMSGIITKNWQVRTALDAARGQRVPVDSTNVPKLTRGTFSRNDWNTGLGLAGPCDIETSDVHMCDEDVEDAYGENAEKVTKAIERGVRHLDSAFLYGTDRFVGYAWKDSGVPREKFFITTKLKPADDPEDDDDDDEDEEEPADWVESQLKALKTDYVDALFFHHDYRTSDKAQMRTWEKVQEMQDDGMVDSLGVSSVLAYNDWRKCVKKGVCDDQSILFQLEPPICSRTAQQLHTDHTLQHLVDDETELVFHTATMCRSEPVMESMAKRMNSNFYEVTMAWMQSVGSAALFTTLNPKHVKSDLKPALELQDEEIAGLWGLSLIYGLAWCDGEYDCQTPDGDWCSTDSYYKGINFDPLGIKELFKGTDGPCVGAKPDWAKEEDDDNDDDDDDD